MSSKLTGLIMFFLLCNALIAQQKDTIYGHVKSIREELTFLNKEHQNMKLLRSEGDYGHYGFSSAKFTKSRFNSWWYNTPWVHYINYYKEFTKDEKVLKEIWYYKSQDTLKYTEFQYNDFGKIAKQKEIRYSESNTLYRYDSNQNLVYAKTMESDGSVSTKHMTYTADNKIARISYFDSDKLEEIDVRENYYNMRGNLIMIKKYNEYGESYGTKYVYDARGRKTKHISYWPFIWVKKGQITRQKRIKGGNDRLHEEYIYNDQDKIIQINKYYEDDIDRNKVVLSRKLKMTYKDGLLMQMHNLDNQDSISSYTIYEYDIEKRKIKETLTVPKLPKYNRESSYSYTKDEFTNELIYQEGNRIVNVKYEYIFDEKNNWIQQTKIVDGERLFAWKRKIEYYD